MSAFDKPFYLVFAGQDIEPWVYEGNLPNMDRAGAIKSAFASWKALNRVIRVDLANGKSEDVTREIAWAVVNHWADNDEPFTQEQREFKDNFTLPKSNVRPAGVRVVGKMEPVS